MTFWKRVACSLLTLLLFAAWLPLAQALEEPAVQAVDIYKPIFTL